MTNKKLKISLVLLLIACILCACNRESKKEDVGKPDYAVIRTSKYKECKTQIVLLDENLKYAGEKEIDYGNVGGCGFNIPTDMNGKTYEISQAYGDEMFPSKIIEIDDNDWSCKSYDFDRTNITDLAVTNKYVYAISNLNGVIYIEKCPINGGKKNIVTMKEEVEDGTGIYIYNVGDTLLYGILESSLSLYKCDFEGKKTELLTKIKDIGEMIPIFSEEYNGKLFLATSKNVLLISPDTGNTETINIPEGENDIKSIYKDGDILYISRAEFYEQNDNTEIIKYDLKSKKVMDTYKVKTSLMQFEVKNNKLVVITGDTILKYSLKDNGQVAKEGEYQVKSSKYQYISAGFFVDK